MNTIPIQGNRSLLKRSRSWNLSSLLVLCCAFALLALTGAGCKNTAHGAGKDIENIGEKIQEKTD